MRTGTGLANDEERRDRSGLLSLYPSSDDPKELRQVVNRHARQLEMGVTTDETNYKQIKAPTATLDRTNVLLEQLGERFQMDQADRKLTEARKEHALKWNTALLGFAGSLTGALLAGAVAYATHSPANGEPKAPTQSRRALGKDRCYRPA